MKNFKLDGFVISMIIAVLFSFIFPQIGAKGSPLHLDLVTTLGVSFVFLLHGANLSLDAVKAGIMAWRLHLFVQITTFVIFPIIGFIIYYGGKNIMPEAIRLGFFFLCALPSTISSSVAMTAIGKGNVPGAIFDATLSGVIGMIITPFLVSIIQRANGGHIDVLGAVFEIMETLLLPFAIGQILRPIFKGFLAKYKKIINLTDRSVIILIVFVAFCNSNISGVWQKNSPLTIIGIFILVAIILATVLTLTTITARKLGFNHEDEVAGVFCGSKKSLANGAPIAAILFNGNPMMGAIILPVMIYHQLQLMVCSIIAQKYADKQN